MIHILHHQTDRITGWISRVKDDTHQNSIKNEETYKFQVSMSEKGASEIGARSRILIPDEEADYREFVVSYINENSFSMEKEVEAKGSFVDIRKSKIISPQVLDAQTIQTAGGMVLSDLEWEIGIVEYSGIRKWTIERHLDAYEALKAIASLFECELRFRVTVDGDQVTGRYVDFIKKQGLNRGKETLFGKDLVGITRKVNADRIVTALHCIGPERQDGTRLEVVVKDDEAFQNWNRKGKHLIEPYEPESSDQEMTLERLTSLGKTELKKRISAAIEYELEAVSLEHILGYEHEITRLGDSIKIKDEHFNPPMYLESRVIFVDRSIFNKGKKSFKLGEVIEYKKEDVMKTWRELQALYATKVIKSPTAPPGKPNIIWIQTGGSVEIAHTWDITQNTWIKATPTEASEVGAETPEGAQGKANTARDEAKAYTSQQLTNYVSNTTYQQDITEIQNQIDGNITSWFYAYDPTLSNAPADSWTTIEDKNTHLGDLFYNTSSGYAWRFALESGVYKWISVKDTDVTKALSDAAKAQDTADEKRRTFVAQPIPPYDIGDLWANGQTVYRCKLAKASGGSYDAGDWEKIGDVTNQNTSKDTSNVNGVPSTEVVQRISAAESSITQNANEIALRVTKTEFEDLSFGGRNLLKGSKTFDPVHWANAGVVNYENEWGYFGNIVYTITADWWYAYHKNTPLIPGQQYTLSFLGFSSIPDVTIHASPEPDKVVYEGQLMAHNMWEKYEFTFIASGEDFDHNVTGLRVEPSNLSGRGGYVHITRLMLEEGNRASDWSPNPDDAEEAINALGTRVTSAESSITQNANEIALRVTRTEAYSAMDGGSIVTNSNFNKWGGVYPDGISGWDGPPPIKVSTATGNGLKFENTGGANAGVHLSANGGFFKQVENAQYLVLEVDVMLNRGNFSGAGVLVDWDSAGSRRYTLNLHNEIPNPEWNKWYSIKKTIKRSGDPGDLIAGYLMGNWDGIDILTDKDIVYDRLLVRKATAEEVSTFENVPALLSRMSTAESSITQNANEINLRVTKTEFDNMKIGTSNILRNSAKFKDTGYWGSHEWGLTNVVSPIGSLLVRNDEWTGNEPALEAHIGHLDSGEYGFYQIFNTIPGKKYMLSGYIAGHRSNKKIVVRRVDTGTWIAASENIGEVYGNVFINDWHRFEIPFTAESTASRIDFFITSTIGDDGYLWLKSAKVEEGDKATAWSPSYEDTNARLNSAESSITQQANQISQKVSQTDYNGNTIASLINQTATTILLQAAKIALNGYVEAKHIKSLNGLNINDQFIVDVNGNVSMAGILKAIGSSNYMQLSGDTLVAGGYTGAPVGGRTLLSVLSTIPNMFDGNYSDPEIKGHGKLYTHTARIWVPAQTFSTSAWVEYTLDLTGYDSVAIQVVSAVSLQSRAKEMYAYERVDGRYPTVGDLRRIVIRLSPHYNFTSPGFYVEVDVMILGWR